VGRRGSSVASVSMGTNGTLSKACCVVSLRREGVQGKVPCTSMPALQSPDTDDPSESPGWTDSQTSTFGDWMVEDLPYAAKGRSPSFLKLMEGTDG
jgi:hypothetical protein